MFYVGYSIRQIDCTKAVSYSVEWLSLYLLRQPWQASQEVSLFRKGSLRAGAKPRITDSPSVCPFVRPFVCVCLEPSKPYRILVLCFIAFCNFSLCETGCLEDRSFLFIFHTHNECFYVEYSARQMKHVESWKLLSWVIELLFDLGTLTGFTGCFISISHIYGAKYLCSIQFWCD